ncbi:MAG TPA: penicillin-binding protein 1C [Steroidobacteraceae bacterium]
MKLRLCLLSILPILLLTAVGVRLWPRPPLAARIPSSVAVLDADGQLLRLTMARDQQYRLWVPLSAAPPELTEALLLHEDQQFYHHFGVNPIALVRAAGTTYTGGPRLGGSTITMQLARLMYGLNTRTARGKLRQIWLAVVLELCYSKREILEAHINLMPYGGNVQGVGAASLIYFGKPPARLSLSEAFDLVLVPQSPTARSPRTRAPEWEPASLTAARHRLFREWVKRHPTAKDQSDLIAVPLRFNGPRALPFEAPHFTSALLTHPDASFRIDSTLDLHSQRIAERILHAYVQEQGRLGIHNAAALLVDYRDMSVRAAVGSANFRDATISGQVDGTLAKRSPGSALKPFVYALAIDQGLIHPMTVLKDAPTSFGAYSPENFDGQFVGPISATDALIHSRNVPAVALTAQLSQPSFYQFLRSAGISRMDSERHYGLALALGGGEVTMEEMASLYATLANGGVLRPLRHRKEESSQARTRLLSEQASFITLRMLEQNPRPDDSPVAANGGIPIAWKTGTSWGFRDAWTAGVFGQYVLIVWVGNFDASSNPAFVGVQAAAPLFFRIVDALRVADPTIHPLSLRPPAGVTRIDVCAASGDLPNAECPRTVSTWFIPGKSPIRVSEVHRRVWIDDRTGKQACPPYDLHHVRSEIYEFWPSDVLKLFAQAGMPRRIPPPTAACENQAPAGIPPQIHTPLANITYALRAARVGSESIPLTAAADGGVRTIHWFVNDAYVGTSAPDVALTWTPRSSGSFTVRAIDEDGRADSRELRVAVVP